MSEPRKVPFFNYPALYGLYKEELKAAVIDVMERGAYILQRDLEEFEDRLKSFTGAKYAFGVADGTNALIIALRSAGIGAGDEVIMPSHTYIATAAAAHLVGAKPVLVECGNDHMMDPQDAAKAITSKTKAIMPVQVNGRTCDMDAIAKLAEGHDLTIVEDSAQALGSKFKGRCAGTFGAAGTYSFYPAKLLGCFGDGGGIVTNSAEMAKKISLWRDHGRDESGTVVAWGTNSRLDNVQAAVLNLKFRYFEGEIERRRDIARRYQAGLGDLGDLALPPAPDDDGDHFDVYQNYELEAHDRDRLKEFLAEKGIGTIIQWAGKAVHQFPELKLNDRDLPKTDRLFERCLMLPMNVSLGDEDIEWVVRCVREFYGKANRR